MKSRSVVWDSFIKTSDTLAKCKYCSTVYSVKGGSTANLLRHMRTQHPTVSLLQYNSTIHITAETEMVNPEVQSERSSSENPLSQPTCAINNDVPSVSRIPSSTTKLDKTSKKHGIKRNITKISDYISRPLLQSKKMKIDFQVVKMIATHYQPFSIVEDTQFQTLINMLNPSYRLPTRKTISNNLLPQMYNMTAEEVKKQLASATAVTVTTDGWTSMANDSYLAVTVHFIDNNCTMKSYLLDCFSYPERHTAENLANELKRILHEWNVFEKVVAVVTDNASNVIAAVRLCGWKHIPCYAHTLNLIVQASLKEIEQVHIKIQIQQIVAFFKKSPQASAKLREIQNQMGTVEIKPKQDVPNRWNSTYDMFSRVLKIKDALVSTLALVNFQQEVLTLDDWKIVEHCCDILKCFYEITVDVSSERNVTISKLIVYSTLTARHLENLDIGGIPVECQNMIRVLQEQIKKRFQDIEMNLLLAETTFLDPRFKKYGFLSDSCYEKAKASIIQLSAKVTVKHSDNNKATGSNSQTRSTSSTTTSEKTLWDFYDEQTSHLTQNRNSTAESLVEINRYIQEPLLKRCENPLFWWQERRHIYPRLFEIVKKRLCIVATSVPCEKVFSKGGLVVTEKRSRLSPKKVKQLVFLNFNLKSVDSSTR